MGILDFFKRKQQEQSINSKEGLTLSGDEFEIIKIEYIALFDWHRTFLNQPVIYKICIDVNNGTFYLLMDGDLHPISDERFIEIAKEVSDECYNKHKELPKNKNDFIINSKLPHNTFNYKNKLLKLIKVTDGTNVIVLKQTSYSGWLLLINTVEIIIGERYFYENTIHDFLNLIKKHNEHFDHNMIMTHSEILKEFRLIGDCGYAPLQLMGTGYEKDPYRKLTDLVTYKYENGVLYISGQGATAERDEGGDCGRCCSRPENSVFCKYILDETVKVIFGEGITKIGKYFLSDFKKLNEIVLSSTVEVFEKQHQGTTFKRAPIEKIHMYPGQKQPFGEHVKLRMLTK
jgi:hypothetical protein